MPAVRITYQESIQNGGEAQVLEAFTVESGVHPEELVRNFDIDAFR